MVERIIPLKTYVLKDIRTEEKMAEAELEYFGPLPLIERKTYKADSLILKSWSAEVDGR